MHQATVIQPRLITLILLNGLAISSLNLFLPSLPGIAVEFEASYALVNLSIAGYAAMTAILQLVLGPLSDRFGRRPVILFGLLVFSLASLGCLLATNITSFLFFRMMQAAIISAHTVSYAVIRDSSQERKAASLMGYVAMAWAIAPMLAPVLGGTLDELFGWRASFWAFLLLGTAIFGLCLFDLHETNIHPSKTLHEQFQSYPELLRSRRFWGYALCMAFSTGAFYAFLGGAPLVASTLFDMSPARLGLYMGSITAGFIFGSFLAGRYAARYPLTTMMISGRVVACAGLLTGFVVVLMGHLNEFTLFGACIFVGIGNGITMPSSSSGALSVRPKLAGSASGLSGALVVAGGAAVSAITGSVLTDGSATYGLLGTMLVSSALGLGAALYVLYVDRH
ncbi:MAG: multidrug effflux MFS transporter [Gammaproteobacteria bacterium]|nr:multidrug effflux MFS transporter [Gammaproteobacteria bacterium]MYI88906.1 multidrug effflux MFS transporter [Gammaproteobacteria bacterium]